MLFAFVLKILRTILVFDVIGLFFGFQSLLSGFHQVTFFVAIQVFFFVAVVGNFCIRLFLVL